MAKKGVFISHSSKDSHFCERLVERLESAGVQCWYSARDISVSQTYSKEIINSLNSAKTVIVVVSKHSLISTHVLREVEYASSNNKQLICIKLDKTELPEAFEYFLRLPNWVEAYKELTDQIFVEILKGIKSPPKNFINKSKSGSKLLPSIMMGLILIMGVIWLVLDSRPSDDIQMLKVRLLENLNGLVQSKPQQGQTYQALSNNITGLLEGDTFTAKNLSDLSTFVERLSQNDIEGAKQVLISSQDLALNANLMSFLENSSQSSNNGYQETNELTKNQQVFNTHNQSQKDSQKNETYQNYLLDSTNTLNNRNAQSDTSSYAEDNNIDAREHTKFSVFKTRGYGHGDSLDLAQQEAKNALFTNILKKINSNPRDYSFEATKKNNIHTIYYMPSPRLSYVINQLNSSNRGYEFSAQFDPNNSFSSYQSAIESVQSKIEDLRLKATKPNSQLETSSKLLAAIEHHAKLQAMYKLIAGTFYNETQYTELKNETESNRLAYQSVNLTLEQAAKHLTAGMDEENILVLPAITGNTYEVTPFAHRLYYLTQKYIKSTQEYREAKYWLTGSYEELDEGLIVRFFLSDQNGNTIKANIAFINSANLSNHSIKPLVPGQLIKPEFTSSENDYLSIEISMNQLPSPQAVSIGQELSLTIKANKANYYFFLVGHTIIGDTQISYLLDIGSDTSRLIHSISTDKSNQWIEIAEFRASPPYGVEYIQVIASTDNLVKALPKHAWDNKTGYYQITDNIHEGIKLARTSIAKLKKEQPKTQIDEAILSFSIFKTN